MPCSLIIVRIGPRSSLIATPPRCLQFDMEAMYIMTRWMLYIHNLLILCMIFIISFECAQSRLLRLDDVLQWFRGPHLL